MDSFKIEYKQNYSLAIILSVFLLAIFSPFIWVIFNKTLTSQDKLVGYYFLSLPFVVTVIFWIYTCKLVISNIGHTKFIELKKGVLSFPPSAASRKLIRLKVSDFESVRFFDTSRSRHLILQFVVNGKRYGINDASLSEKQFSILCNAIVKRSGRCKACQSSQVTWRGELGRCHNCETITPVSSDKFNWDEAYQA